MQIIDVRKLVEHTEDVVGDVRNPVRHSRARPAGTGSAHVAPPGLDHGKRSGIAAFVLQDAIAVDDLNIVDPAWNKPLVVEVDYFYALVISQAGLSIIKSSYTRPRVALPAPIHKVRRTLLTQERCGPERPCRACKDRTVERGNVKTLPGVLTHLARGTILN